MNILEFWNSNSDFEQNPHGYDTVTDDNSVQRLKDLRKTRLTLRQLNRLRIMNDVRKLEHEQKIDSIRSQYGADAGTDVNSL